MSTGGSTSADSAEVALLAEKVAAVESHAADGGAVRGELTELQAKVEGLESRLKAQALTASTVPAEKPSAPRKLLLLVMANELLKTSKKVVVSDATTPSDVLVKVSDELQLGLAPRHRDAGDDETPERPAELVGLEVRALARAHLARGLEVHALLEHVLELADPRPAQYTLGFERSELEELRWHAGADLDTKSSFFEGGTVHDHTPALAPALACSACANVRLC